tara:strand:+ start:568 stop:837 length:270 start_codon:yes stop_codon:yes gene_type:complete
MKKEIKVTSDKDKNLLAKLGESVAFGSILLFMNNDNQFKKFGTYSNLQWQEIRNKISMMIDEDSESDSQYANDEDSEGELLRIKDEKEN